MKGAHISGDGIIELPLVTNTGRTFIYQQKSENGAFVVPYSTLGNPYDVRATGQYHIVGTSRYHYGHRKRGDGRIPHNRLTCFYTTIRQVNVRGIPSQFLDTIFRLLEII